VLIDAGPDHEELVADRADIRAFAFHDLVGRLKEVQGIMTFCLSE